MQYDDAFTLQKVEDEYVDIFNYMAGMVPLIQKLIRDVSVKNFEPTHIAGFQDGLIKYHFET